MTIHQVEINDDLVSGYNHNEKLLASKVNEALALIEYVKCKISLGKLAELTGRGVIETKEWVNDMGLFPKFDDDEIEERQEKAFETLMNSTK